MSRKRYDETREQREGRYQQDLHFAMIYLCEGPIYHLSTDYDEQKGDCDDDNRLLTVSPRPRKP
eukprot:scaffold2992_cov214-Amphora_coffeaeformis.AAC.34